MSKIWLVIKHEYLKHVKKKRFILALLSLPFFILLMVAIGFLSAFFQFDDTPIGYVDYSTLLNDPIEYQAEPPMFLLKPMQIIQFQNIVQAKDALDQGDIQAYYVLDKDFTNTKIIQVTAKQALDANVNGEFLTFLRKNILKEYPEELSNRIMEGANFDVRSIEGDRSSSDQNIMDFILPFLVGFLFIMAINISGGYLLQAVVEEKENRTMEIMVTSLSPTQLMTAKVIGNLSVGLTQLVVWILFGLAGIALIFRMYPDLQLTQIDASYLLLIILVFLPAFVMVAAMMATLGATTTSAQEAQQIAGIFSLPMVIPFWFIQVLMEKPNSILSIFLSLFPFTAPISLPIRAAFSNIPIWQSVLTVSLLILFAIGSLWIAGRSFRMGMLRYGKKLSLKEIFTQRH